LTAKI